MTNEKSSKRVASIAGKLSKVLAKAEKSGCKYLFTSDSQYVMLADVRAVVGSALTQAPDKEWITDKSGSRKFFPKDTLHSQLMGRLAEIAGIIEAVDDRCLAHEGPVTPTLNEIRPAELRKIYKLAKGSTSKRGSK